MVESKLELIVSANDDIVIELNNEPKERVFTGVPTIGFWKDVRTRKEYAVT